MGTKDWKTALVTGGAGGLGFELARQCAARGMDVVLVGRNEERLVAAAAQLALQQPSPQPAMARKRCLLNMAAMLAVRW